MPRILIIDTLYPDFISSVPLHPSGTYESELQRLLDRKFGTSDFYSRNLKALAWEAFDFIDNHEALRKLNRSIDIDPIAYYKPDVVFSQDLSLPIPRGDYLLAGQHSCPWAGDENVRKYDILFSSFPHYIPRIEALGVRAIYNPLAFEPTVLDSTRTPSGILSTSRALSDKEIADFRAEWAKAYQERERLDPVIVGEKFGMTYRDMRIHDCVFIGGVGNPSHWRYGMEVLETVAREIPTFKWWGYGVETLPSDSALRAKYQGQAWGLDMYEILLQSKICLNRHGEVADGFANNMKLFEITGTGALLLTEWAINIHHLFHANEIETYLTPEDAVMMIRYYLAHEDERAAIAARGQKRTLADHTYAKRMKVVSDTLKEMVVAA